MGIETLTLDGDRIFDAIVIGGGIGGLSLGYFLAEQGRDVLILDEQSYPGGVCDSGLVGEFLCERGPNSTIEKPALTRIIQHLKLEAEVVRPLQKKRYLASNRSGTLTLTAAPQTPVEAFTTPLLSRSAKLRVFSEIFSLRTKDEDKSVRAFSEARFGREVTDNLVSAALGGIYAADISALSARTALPLLWELQAQSGSIIRGAVKKAFQGPKKKRGEMLSFRKGLSHLPLSIAKYLGGRLQINVKVSALEFDQIRQLGKVTVDGRQLLTRQIVLASPARVTAELIRGIFPALATQIAQIPYSPLGILHVTAPKSSVGHALDGFGFLKPPHLGSPLLGAIFSSSLFPDRAPSDTHLITCMVGGSARPNEYDVTDPNIQSSVLEELAALLGMNAKPNVILQTVWQEAIPLYPLHHHKLVQSVRQHEVLSPQIRFLGNWLEGISFADRIESAERLAEAL